MVYKKHQQTNKKNYAEAQMANTIRAGTKMARRNSGGGGLMTKALGRMVGLLLSLYVFDEVIDAIMPSVNSSTYFSTAVTFVDNLFPVIGILGAFEIIYSALRTAKLV